MAVCVCVRVRVCTCVRVRVCVRVCCRFVTVLMLSGVRVLGCELVDPFGDDPQDFPVYRFMTEVRSSVAPIIRQTAWYPTSTPSDTQQVRSVALLSERHLVTVPLGPASSSRS